MDEMTFLEQELDNALERTIKRISKYQNRTTCTLNTETRRSYEESIALSQLLANKFRNLMISLDDNNIKNIRDEFYKFKDLVF